MSKKNRTFAPKQSYCHAKNGQMDGGNALFAGGCTESRAVFPDEIYLKKIYARHQMPCIISCFYCLPETAGFLLPKANTPDKSRGGKTHRHIIKYLK
jgi:hypothetical protein